METNSNIIKNALKISIAGTNNDEVNQATLIINQESIKKSYFIFYAGYITSLV
jgi:hypothetical protein